MSGSNGTFSIDIPNEKCPVNLPGGVCIEMDLAQIQRDIDGFRVEHAGKSRWEYLDVLTGYFKKKFPDHEGIFNNLDLVDRLDEKLLEGFLILKKKFRDSTKTISDSWKHGE